MSPVGLCFPRRARAAVPGGMLKLSCPPRWLCYCHVPQSCDSLPRYETTHVFGRSLLKSIFTVTRRQLLEKFRVEKDKLVPEKRTLILTHFPK